MGKTSIERGQLIMIANTDIDIDIADRNKLLDIIKNTPAMIDREGKKTKHNTGVYFHDVPKDPFTGYCTVDFKKAESIGYFKLDILNVNIYDRISSKQELDDLLNMEPVWELLEYEEVVSKLFHIHNHFNIVKTMKPKSLEQLAAILAIIRPAKRHLLNKSWDKVFDEVWVKPADSGYFFKKAHAHAYAMAIILQLNMLVRDSS